MVSRADGDGDRVVSPTEGSLRHQERLIRVSSAVELLKHARVWALTFYLLTIGFFVLLGWMFRTDVGQLTLASARMQENRQEMRKELTQLVNQVTEMTSRLTTSDLQIFQLRQQLEVYERLLHPEAMHQIDLELRLEQVEKLLPPSTP